MAKKIFNQDIAEEFVGSDEYIEDLVYMEDYSCFYLWSGNFLDRPEGHFVKLTQDEMLRRIHRFCKSRGYTQNYTTNIYKDLENLIKLFIIKRMPCEDDKYVAFKDVLLNIETFEIEPFSKQKICTTYFPYNYEEIQQETPVFKKFLATSLVYEDDVFKTDEQLVTLAQEIMGSLILNNLKASKSFFFYGRTASNGKSQFSHVIENIFGFDQCSSLSLADFSDKFTPISLVGKRVNIAGELDEKFGNSKAFKSLVTGDRIKAEWKHGDVVFFTPKTKYVFLTNKVPTFDGFDRGVRRRILFLPFHREFKISDPDIDVNLKEKLKKETAGIIGWMIEGAKRLVANKYQFTESKASIETIHKFENEMSSASMFITEEGWALNNDGYVTRVNLYEKYKEWSYASGKKTLSRNRFYEDLENIINGLKVSQRYTEGKPQWCFNLSQFFGDIPDVSLVEEGTEIIDGKIEEIKF